MKTTFAFFLFVLLWMAAPQQGRTQVLQIDTVKTVQPAEWLFYYFFDDRRGNPPLYDSLLIVRTTDTVRQWARLQGNERMQWYADLFRAALLWRTNLFNLETYSYYLRDSAKFGAAPFDDVRAVWWYFVGSQFTYKGDYERAFPYLIKAEEMAERIGYARIPGMVFFWDEIFHFYYHVGDYPAALRCLERLLQSGRPLFSHRPRAYHLGNLGETYLGLKNIPKAKEAFLQSIAEAQRTGNAAWVGISSGNYGHVLQLEGRYREALPYLYRDIALNEQRLPDNTAITFVFLANSLLRLDSVEKAGDYLRRAPQMSPNWRFSHFGLHYYRAMAHYHRQTGDFRNSFNYLDSLLRLRDSLRIRNDVALFKFMALRSEEQKLHDVNAQREVEAYKIRWSRNTIIAFLLLLLAGVTVYLHQKRQREKAALLARQQEDTEKLQQAERELAQYIETIREKNNLLEQVEARLALTTGLQEYGETPMLASFQGLSLVNEEDWQRFKALFSAAYPRFLPELENRYPALSPAEQRLLALQKLQLSSRETAAMLGISSESLRKSRYRLRKKYPELLDDAELKDLL